MRTAYQDWKDNQDPDWRPDAPTQPPEGLDELITLLGLERTLQDQLIPANFEDFQSDWSYTLQQLMAWRTSYAKEAERGGRISGMEQARDRVLRRTEIPADARNPTRDAVVIIGEECARIINGDIAALKEQGK